MNMYSNARRKRNERFAEPSPAVKMQVAWFVSTHEYLGIHYILHSMFFTKSMSVWRDVDTNIVNND